jgi:hypothetical protein
MAGFLEHLSPLISAWALFWNVWTKGGGLLTDHHFRGDLRPPALPGNLLLQRPSPDQSQ